MPAPSPVSALTSRGRISTPSFATVEATSAIWNGVTNVSPWPNDADASSTSSLNPPGAGPSPSVTRLIEVGRSNGIGAPNPSRSAWPTRSSPPVSSPARAYQMLQLASVAPTRSSGVSPVCGWWPSRMRKPSTSRPLSSAFGCSSNVVSGEIDPVLSPAMAVTTLNTEPGT